MCSVRQEVSVRRRDLLILPARQKTPRAAVHAGRRKEAPAMTSETHLLEMLGHGAPMLEVLNELCNFIDTQSQSPLCFCWIATEYGSGQRLGPNIPKLRTHKSPPYT